MEDIFGSSHGSPFHEHDDYDFLEELLQRFWDKIDTH
jgi:hypothetical protein